MTIRAIGQLLALWADNVTNQIDAIDGRDILDSLDVRGELILEDGDQDIGSSGELLEWSSNGQVKGNIVDYSAGTITIGTNCQGNYLANFFIGFRGREERNYEAWLRVNGVEIIKTQCGTAEEEHDRVCMSLNGFLALAEGDVVDIWVKTLSGSSRFDAAESRLTILRVL